MRDAGSRRRSTTLQHLTIDAVAKNIDRFDCLGMLPLEVAVALLRRVLELGLLSTHSFKLFQGKFSTARSFLSSCAWARARLLT